ncbi:MAG TPA: zinc-ribbon domain-containing protein, partial [Candidatus Poseidoniales archaeon]
MAFCPSCAKEVDATWKACPFCGESLGQVDQQARVAFTDSAMSGDIHHTVVNNDPAAV